MNSKNKILFALLTLSAVLLFNIAQTFHHHEHIEDELKCQICILSSSVDIPEISFNRIDKIFQSEEIQYPENDFPFVQNYLTFNNPLRAPPTYL